MQHRQWVFRELDRWAARWGKLPKPWPYGNGLFYRGEEHEVLLSQARPGGVEVAPDRKLKVKAPSAGVPGARRVLQCWLKQEAASVLKQRVEALGAAMGLKASRLYVRNLRSSWGRCWQGGSLSFNYRLVMAPPHVLDYVVVHELSHMKEMNHSPRFWQVVAGQFPEYRSARAWLRDFGPCLTL